MNNIGGRTGSPYASTRKSSAIRILDGSGRQLTDAKEISECSPMYLLLKRGVSVLCVSRGSLALQQRSYRGIPGAVSSSHDMPFSATTPTNQDFLIRLKNGVVLT